MARKSSVSERRPANISYDQMETAIPKLERRISELRSFNIQTLQSGNDASLMALTQKIDVILIDMFGSASHEYYQYRPYAELRVLSLNRENDGQIKHWVQENLNRAITMLETIKGGFLESLQDAGISGTSFKAIKAYDGLELHPVIAHAVSELFRDGYHANAVEDAVKALTAAVRLKSGFNEDGRKLMQKCFGSDKPKIPPLQFNPLQDDSD